jgi:hypothetical protein
VGGHAMEERSADKGVPRGPSPRREGGPPVC